jgi:hypothetical protein
MTEKEQKQANISIIIEIVVAIGLVGILIHNL